MSTLKPINPHPAATAVDNRQALADVLRYHGERMQSGGKPEKAAIPDPQLSPRVRQTLDRLLAGDSEKQIAAHLHLSPHTVHIYIKSLYRHFSVNSRGELLAQFVTPR